MSTPSLATAFGDERESPGLAMWRATNAWQAKQRACLKGFGLTHVQFVLLASLIWLRADGPVTQHDLAEHAQTDPMMTSQVLRVLEERSWIVRDPHPTDRRARSLRVTAEGAALANRAVEAVEAVDRSFFSVLTDGGRRLTDDLNALLAAPQLGSRPD